MTFEKSEKESKELRVILESEIFDKIEIIKEYYGIKNMTELIRFLVNKIEREIQFKKLELQEKKMTIEMVFEKMKDIVEKYQSKEKTD